ncbi:MAG: hypothetical protein RIQ70_95 [Bacteroidota bacterium]
MKKLFILFLIFNIGLQAFSQKIQVKFVDKFSAPLFGVTVNLRDSLNKSFQLNNFTDTSGKAEFNLKANSIYLLRASSVGYRPFGAIINTSDKGKAYVFILLEDSQNLGSVTVTAKKPLMRQEDDKTIVDPEPLAGMSTNAFELIEKTPGLFVDQDGNVYLNSSSPARIYINGREQKLGPADIASILKSLPPNSIEKIEIIRTPSASMDASSSGGAVNVVLKKGVKLGRTGTVNAGFNQGRFGNQFVGINLNRSQETRSSYLSLNFNHRKTFDESTFERVLGAENRNLNTDSYSIFPAYSIFSGFGANFDISKKLEVGYDGRLSYSDNQSRIENNSEVVNSVSSVEKFSQNTNLLENNTQNYNINQGINAKYKFDEKGSELRFDASLDYFETNGGQDYNTNFVIPTPINFSGAGDWLNSRTLFASMLDFKYLFPKKFTLETGLKTSIQNFDSKTDYTITRNANTTKDAFRTNAFDYYENINAAYFQMSKIFGEYVLKTGARLENTVMKGRQTVPSDTTFSINRTDLFPYIFFSRKLFKIASYDLRGYLIARRTISRPVYEYLNPFPRFVDQYIYEAGNPSLRPQFTNNIEANISFDERPIFAIGRNYVKDIFTSVVMQDKADARVSYRTYQNLGKNTETYFRFLGAIPPGKKYFFVVGTVFMFNDYEGQLDSKPITFSKGTWSFFTFHQLRLDSRSSLYVNGFYRTNGQQQFYELSNFGNLDLSINRQFFNKKLVVTAQMRDLFFSNNYSFTLDQGNINAKGFRRNDSRRFGINIRYNFGQKKKNEGFDMFNVEGMDSK